MVATVVNIRRDAAIVKRAAAAGTYVYIGRPSPWGNPFAVKASKVPDVVRVATVEDALQRYEEWIKRQSMLLDQLPTLVGKVLGCWCKPGPCHGDVLVRLLELRQNGD